MMGFQSRAGTGTGFFYVFSHAQPILRTYGPFFRVRGVVFIFPASSLSREGLPPQGADAGRADPPRSGFGIASRMTEMRCRIRRKTGYGLKSRPLFHLQSFAIPFPNPLRHEGGPLRRSTQKGESTYFDLEKQTEKWI
jgi:hypothetical protein